jgi:ABC-2 type transport system permease protein
MINLSPRRIRAIYRKDLRDAIRDSRVLLALVLPFGIGIFYNFTFKDKDVTTIQATVAYASPDQTALPNVIRQIGGSGVKITFHEMTADAVRTTLSKNDADFGLIVPAGFDAAVKSGNSPNLTVVERAKPNVEGDFVAAALDPALRALAGQAPPATIDVAQVERDVNSQSVQDALGIRTWAVLAAVVMMIAMVGMLAIPVVLAEESERKTLDALVLVSNYSEVVLAKALLGITYVAVSVPLLLRITNISPESKGLFIAAAGLLAVDLIGLGLLMAGLFKSANQLNTWSGIIMLPVIAPAFAVGLPAPRPLEIVFGALPSGAAAKLFFNSASGHQLFPNPAAYIAIIIAWGVVAYALLLWRLSRRQA